MTKKLTAPATELDDEDLDDSTVSEVDSEVPEVVEELIRLRRQLSALHERYNMTFQSLIESLADLKASDDSDSQYDIEQILDRYLPVLHLLSAEVKDLQSDILDDSLPGLEDAYV